MSTLYRDRTLQLIDNYNQNPDWFDSKQVAELQSLAEQQGIEFIPKDHDSTLLSMAGNLAKGFFEGFTTIPVGDKPEGTGDKIAHSLGHLGGFAPGIIAAPLKLGLKGLTKLGLKQGSRTYQTIEEASKLAHRMNQYSVPMMAGGYVQKGFEKGLAKAGLEAGRFMRGTAARNIMEQAVHLGAASAVSKVWSGPDDMFEAGVHGAIAGGAFGALGNFVRLGNIIKDGTPKQVENAEKTLRGILGAGLQGAPSALGDEPIEMIIYNTLLGGFFGYNSQPAFKVEGQKFIANLRNEKNQDIFFSPNKHKEWNNVTKETQDHIMNGFGNVNDTAKMYVLRNRTNEKVDLDNLTDTQRRVENYIIERTKAKFNTDNPSKELVDAVFREEARQMYMGESYGYGIEDIVEVNNIVDDQRLDPTDPVTEPKGRVANESLKGDRSNTTIINIDPDGKIMSTRSNKEIDGKVVGEKRVDRPIEKIRGDGSIATYETLSHIRVPREIEVYKDGKFTKETTYEMIKPFKWHMNYNTGKAETIVRPEEFWMTAEHLHNKGKYISGGVKDKGVAIIQNYHESLLGENPLTLRQIIKALSRNNDNIRGEIRDSYRESLNLESEFYGGKLQGKAKDTMQKMHEMQWASEVLHQAEEVGLYKPANRGEAHNLNGLPLLRDKNFGIANNVLASNKRAQLIHDKSYPLQLEGEYTYAIFKDDVVDASGKSLRKTPQDKTDLDGGIYYRENIYNEMQSHTDLPITSSNKPVIVSKVADGGYLAVKAGGRVVKKGDKSKATGKLAEFMEANNLDILIFDSSSKYTGKQQVHDLIFSDGAYSSQSFNTSKLNRLKKNDVRINLGTKESVDSALKPQGIKVQLFGNITTQQANKGFADLIYKEIYEPSAFGTERTNTLVQDFINTGKGDISKIKLNEVDARKIVDIISNPKNENEVKLKEKFLEKIYKIDKADIEAAARGEREEYDIDTFSSSEYSNLVKRNDIILETAGLRDGVRETFKYLRKNEERVLHRYIVDRFIRPKYKWAAKSWLAPKLPEMEIKNGEFKADNDFNPNVKIRVEGADGKFYTQEAKLWDLWNLYRFKSGEKLSSKPKKHNRRVKELEKIFGEDYDRIPIKDIEEALEFTSIRTPADSISGIRVLKFRGFSGEKGTSVFTEGRDNEYLGGADKDSDSVTLYQGFSKKIKDIYKKNAFEWNKGGKIDGEMVESKSDKYASDLRGKKYKETEAPFERIDSKFSPSMKKIVAQNAAKGQTGIGFSVQGKKKMLAWIDAFNNGFSDLGLPKGFTMEFNKKTGEYVFRKDDKIELKLKLKNNGAQNTRELARDMITYNMDSADIPGLTGFDKFNDLLFNQAFSGSLKVKDTYSEWMTTHGAPRDSRGMIISGQPVEYGKGHKWTYWKEAPKFNSEWVAKFTPFNIYKDIHKLNKSATGQSTMEPSQWNALLKRVNLNHSLESIESRIVQGMKESGLKTYREIDIKLMEKANQINAEIERVINSEPKGPRDAWIKSLNKSLNKIDFNVNSFITKGNKFKTTEKFIADNPGFATDRIGNGLYTASSYINITRAGRDIYNQFLANGFSKSQAKDVVSKILEPIAKRAEEIKTSIKDKVGKDTGDTLFREKVEDYDSKIIDFKTELAIKAKRNGIPKELLLDYFDQWLLSPFTKIGTGEIANNVSRFPIQSDAITKKSKSKLFKVYNDIYDNAIKGTQDVKSTLKESFKTDIKPEKYDPKDYSSPTEAANKTVEQLVFDLKPPKPKSELPEGKEFKKKRLGEFKIEDAALTNQDLADVKLLRDTLKDNPQFANAFNDWFPAFHYRLKGIHKEVNAMNMTDVRAVTKYLNDLQTKTSKWGLKVPRWVFRADPRTIDEHMQSVEGKLFTSFTKPVLQKSGKVIKRDVKTFSSTLGMMKEFNKRIQEQETANLSTIEEEFNNRLNFRKDLSVKEATAINDLIILKREIGDAYKESPVYKNLEKELIKFPQKQPKETKRIYKDSQGNIVINFGNRIEKIPAKEYTLDAVIEKYNQEYTNIYKEISEKWIHTPKDDKFLKYKTEKGDKILDIQYFLRNALDPATQGRKLEIIPLETLLRFNYEYYLEKRIKDGSWKKSREAFRKKHPFTPIKKMPYDKYYQHMNFGATEKARREIQEFKEARIKEVYEKEISEGKSEKEASEMAAIEALKWDMVKESGELLSTGLARDVVDAINSNVDFIELSKKTDGIGLNKRNNNILEREVNMPGYDRSPFTIDMYKENIIRNHYKLLQAAMGNYQIDRFESSNAFGKHTKDWAFTLREYLKNSLGHQTTFPENIKDVLEISPRMEDILKGSLYYKLSDHRIMKTWDKVENWFNKREKTMPFSSNTPKITVTAKENPKLHAEQLKARKEYQSRIIHELGRKEAKFQLMTLLANSGTATANMFGGSTMTISSAGFRNFKRANSKKWLTENIIFNDRGNYQLKLKDNKPVKSIKDLHKWISEQGVIDNFIQDELNLNTEWRAEMSKNKKNVQNFIKEARKVIKSNPEVKDETLLELARRYNINKALLKGGAFFMAASERKLRIDAFLSHALQYRDSYGSMAKELPLNDPAVIEAGLKGIESTQFLYHSAFRPAYMRTSLGKVLTRFKLFAFQSIRTRRELYKKAKYYGFEPGTQSFDRFKDLFLLDMVTMALASAYKYSLFDTTLPPPWDWIQESSDWLFGDKRERNRAFFGTYPHAVAPLQIVTPPIMRIPNAMFSALFNNDWDRFMDYHVHTMYPFGRMVRQFDQTFDDKPYGTKFGRGMQQFFRLPTDKFAKSIDAYKVRELRESIIDEQLEGIE